MEGDAIDTSICLHYIFQTKHKIGSLNEMKTEQGCVDKQSRLSVTNTLPSNNSPISDPFGVPEALLANQESHVTVFLKSRAYTLAS